MIPVRMLKFANRHELLRLDNNASVVFSPTADVPHPTIDEFMTECQVGELEPAVYGRGRAHWQRDGAIDPAYARPSWLRNKALSEFLGREPARRGARSPKAAARPLTDLGWQPTVIRRSAAEPVTIVAQRLLVCTGCGMPFERAESLRTKVGTCLACASANDELGPERLTGRMIFDHKTAPSLEIDGRPTKMTADDIAANRRR